MKGLLIFYIIMAIINIIRSIKLPDTLQGIKEGYKKRIARAEELEQKTKDYPKGVVKIGAIFAQIISILYNIGIIYIFAEILKAL